LYFGKVMDNSNVPTTLNKEGAMAQKRVLVIGGGAREHALLWRLAQDGNCDLFAWPGNAGTAEIAQNVTLDPRRLVDGIVALVVDYVVIGPDVFVAQGLVDKLAERGIPAFGPSEAAARLESSKSFALQVMREAHVPHPASWDFLSPQAVVTFAANYGKPIVVKADGLGDGKHVWLCHALAEVKSAAHLCWELHPNEPIVVQELLEGQEVSVFVFTDGHTISPMVAACDYKRAFDGDRGPNTGGMGSYAWPRGWSKKLDKWILEWVIKPTLRRMELRGTPFVGMLYAGIMLTKDGPKILEFNARPGDPETQVILPLLQGNLLEIMQACTEGHLDGKTVSWNRKRYTIGVVMASRGYPGKYESGYAISLHGHHPRNTRIFHASTAIRDGVLITNNTSGRVLTVVGMGRTRKEARQAAYSEVANVGFETAMYRKDIALLV
jgi:phosphoribosylamine---glycine ligase